MLVRRSQITKIAFEGKMFIVHVTVTEVRHRFLQFHLRQMFTVVVGISVLLQLILSLVQYSQFDVVLNFIEYSIVSYTVLCFYLVDLHVHFIL